MTLFDTCGPTETPETSTSTRCGRSTRRNGTSACAPRAPTQYLELKDDFADFYEVDP